MGKRINLGVRTRGWERLPTPKFVDVRMIPMSHPKTFEKTGRYALLVFFGDDFRRWSKRSSSGLLMGRVVIEEDGYSKSGVFNRATELAWGYAQQYPRADRVTISDERGDWKDEKIYLIHGTAERGSERVVGLTKTGATRKRTTSKRKR